MSSRQMSKEEVAAYFDNLSSRAKQTIIEQVKSQITFDENTQDEDILDFIKAWSKVSLEKIDTFVPFLQSNEVVFKRKPHNATTLSGNLVNITDKELQFALSTYQNNHAYIKQLEKDYIKQLEFDATESRMYAKSDMAKPITVKGLPIKENLKILDLPLLRSLYTILLINHRTASKEADNTRAIVYVPDLAHYLGIKARITINEKLKDDEERQNIVRKITSFRDVVGITANGSIFPLLNFEGYDKKADIVSFSSPYIRYLIRILEEKNTIEVKSKRGEQHRKLTKQHHDELAHPTIGNERNKTAVEIVWRILALLHQRGTDKKPIEKLTKADIEKAAYKGARQATHDEFSDNPANNSLQDEKSHKTVAHKSFLKIVEEIPLLQEAFDNAKTTADKNKTLKRAFSKAYELLKKKTDAYKYFKNLEIPPIIPTVSTLDSVLTITHEGKH